MLTRWRPGPMTMRLTVSHWPMNRSESEFRNQFTIPPLNRRVGKLFGLYFYPQLECHIHRQSFRADLHRFFCLKIIKSWPPIHFDLKRVCFIFYSILRQSFEFVWPHFLQVLIWEFFRLYNRIWIFFRNSCPTILWLFSKLLIDFYKKASIWKPA